MRLWWVNTDEADRRKPLSRTLRRRVTFEFTPRPERGTDVRLAGDKRESWTVLAFFPKAATPG